MRRRLFNVLALVLALFVLCQPARSASSPQCFPQILWSNALTGSLPVAAVVDQIPVSAGLPNYDY